jgi:hypothetical protein
LPEVIATWRRGSQLPPMLDDNPARRVTMVELIPQPQTSGPPRSELSAATDMQDRINLTVFDRLVASDYTAFRQLAVAGVKLPRETVVVDAETGETREVARAPYEIGKDRLLVAENPDARFWAFEGDPLTGYLKAVEQDVTQLAAITQTPPYYLTGTMVNLSADAIKAAEAGLVAKVGERMQFVGEDWEAVMRLALTLAPGADVDPLTLADPAAEVLWADAETRSIAQLVDALVKMLQLGVPQEVVWEKLGASAQEIARWRGMADAEAARQAAASTLAVAAAAGQQLQSGAAT